MARDLERHFRATEGMVSLEEFTLLHGFARDVKEGCIVEVGSYRGRSTVALGLGSLDGACVPVFAVDPHEEFIGVLGGRFGPQDRAAFFRAMIESGAYEVVRLVNLSSEVVAPSFNRRIGLLFIDGDHSDAGVRRDFHAWLPHLAPGAIVAFDDATDPKLGPTGLVRHLAETDRFRKVACVGKMVVLAYQPR